MNIKKIYFSVVVQYAQVSTQVASILQPEKVAYAYSKKTNFIPRGPGNSPWTPARGIKKGRGIALFAK